jgi:hypothetical protein
LNAKNLFDSGHSIVREKELADEYAERWRNQKRQPERDLEDVQRLATTCVRRRC